MSMKPVKKVANTIKAKPFLKWAGGKAQLISTICESIPSNINNYNDLTYVEPFVGSGAILFWFLKSFPKTKKAIINDINPDLINLYSIIKAEPQNLIKALTKIQSDFQSLKNEEEQKVFFLEKREVFNSNQLNSLNKASILIFLNKTCYNGLYRVNSKGKFNVPFGKYKKPNICDTRTIMCDSVLLQKVTILNGDYTQTLKHVDSKNSFFYFDPPYKPISKSSSFNTYSSESFDDIEQERLRDFCIEINSIGHKFLLSNSDPMHFDTKNNYFDLLYYDFTVKRVRAIRKINSNSTRRGEITEILVSNYNL